MGAPDEAMLSAQERAALAQLAQRAAADDPRLASQLRGGADRRMPMVARRPQPAHLAAALRRMWLALPPAVCGPLLLVAGLGLTVVGVATGLAVAVVGVALTTAGLGLAVPVLGTRLGASPRLPVRRPGSAD